MTAAPARGFPPWMQHKSLAEVDGALSPGRLRAIQQWDGTPAGFWVIAAPTPDNPRVKALKWIANR